MIKIETRVLNKVDDDRDIVVCYEEDIETKGEYLTIIKEVADRAISGGYFTIDDIKKVLDK